MKYTSGTWLNLPSLGLSIRVLFTGYLMVTGFGLAMAGAQIMLTHGMADGKIGLSIDDIVYSYYGNRDNSKLESKLNGSMKDNAEAADRLAIIKWTRAGSPRDQWDGQIKQIFEDNCTGCHSADGVQGVPHFTSFDAVKKVAATDEGETIAALTRLSHIHLFGIGFIFFFIGLIFSLSVGIPKWLKELAIITPFAFLILDVFSWWLTKYNPLFAWVTIIGGVGYSAASTFMFVTSLYQMWILPWNGKTYQVNEWMD